MKILNGMILGLFVCVMSYGMDEKRAADIKDLQDRRNVIVGDRSRILNPQQTRDLIAIDKEMHDVKTNTTRVSKNQKPQ